MGQHDSNTDEGTGIDFEAVADGVQQMRETVNAMVVALVADGFTDEQARDIVAGLWRSTRPSRPSSNEEQD